MAKAKPISQPSAEVIPILHASCIRLQKLLALCEAELDSLISDPNTSAASKARQIQILSRTIQGLQRDWLKYMTLLHPDVPVIPTPKSTRRITDEEIDAMSEQELRDLHQLLIQDDPDDSIEFFLTSRDEKLEFSSPENLKINRPLSNTPVENSDSNQVIQQTNQSQGKKLKHKSTFSHTFFKKAPRSSDS